MTTEGEFRADHLQLALGPSGLDASGRIVCGARDPVAGIVPAVNVIAGCVPMNLFGGQGPDGKGTITREQLDYATATLVDSGYNEQQIYELIFRGDWGSIQDRAIRWAVGAVHRVETAAARLDPAKLAGTAGNSPTNLNDGGEFTADEAYVETVVPLLANRSAAEQLDVTAGLRQSKFSSFGSVTTYQGGLDVQALASDHDAWQLRSCVPCATHRRAVHEQSADLRLPCRPLRQQPDRQPAVQLRRGGCAWGSYDQPEVDITPAVVGGNRDLQPEEGDSVSAGITLTPPGVPRLEISVDYWRTSLDDVITLDPRGQVYVNACADSGAADACSRITRRPDGTLALVDERHANGASLVAAGYDFDLGYVLETLGGHVVTRVTTTYLDQYDYAPVAGARTLDAAGTDYPSGALPHWRGLGYAEYSKGPWTGSSPGPVRRHHGGMRPGRWRPRHLGRVPNHRRPVVPGRPRAIQVRSGPDTFAVD